MTTNTDFYAALIEQLTARVDELAAHATNATTAYDVVQDMLEPHCDHYTAGDWHVRNEISALLIDRLGGDYDDDDLHELIDYMDDLAENAND